MALFFKMKSVWMRSSTEASENPLPPIGSATVA